MADIALVTANKVHVVESTEQMTLPALETIVAGAPMRVSTTGKFQNGNGSSSTEAVARWIATQSVAAGETVTGVRIGVMDGFALSTMAYQDKVYLSDTDGTLGTTAGTVSVVIGVVVPAWAQALGTAADKLLLVSGAAF